MAMNSADRTRTAGRGRDYSDFDLTGGRDSRRYAEPERREYRSAQSRPTGMAQPITRRDVAMENAGRFYDDELGDLMMEGILGEDSGLGAAADIAASAVPGGALAEKLATGKRPGLLDMPGPSELKMAALILGVPTRDILRAVGKKYLAGSDDAAEAFSRRMGAFPEPLQDAYALTFAEREGARGVPTASVPAIGVGNDIRGNRGYYRAKFTAGDPTTNGRVLNVNSGMGMSPDEAARQLQIEGSKALSADLGKFSNPVRARSYGMLDQGELGEKAGQMIAGSNKGLFNKLSNISDPDAVEFIETMSQDPELYKLYQIMQNPKLNEDARLAIMSTYPEEVVGKYSDAYSDGWLKTYPPEVLKAVEDVGRNRLSKDDIGTLISGGARFGGLDQNVSDMFKPRWVRDDELAGETFGRLMANYSDRAGVPMLNPTLLKMSSLLTKGRDMRVPGNGMTSGISFEGIGHPEWKRKGF